MVRRLERIEGRLFTEGGCLFLVVSVDNDTGAARVSCRVDGKTQIFEMPLAEVTQRVSSGANLILDNLNAPDSVKRIRQKDGAWFFAAREGQIGPYDSQEQARQELVRYILSMQTVNEGGRAPRRPVRARRRETASSPQPA